MPYPIAFGLDRRIDTLLPAPSQTTRAAQARPETRRAQLATPAPPPPPVRPGQPHAPSLPVRAPRRQVERSPGRDAQPPRERDPVGEASEGGRLALPVAARGERDHQQRGDDGHEDTSLASAVAADPGAQEEMDGPLIAALLAQSHDSGMFEVLLPGGESLGVAVDVRADAVDYLLTPASERVATQLRGRQMELAGQLGQRIGRSVRVTVL